MAGQAGLTELAAGSVLLLGGTEWTVTAIEAQHGRVMLASGGDERWRSIRWLVHHPDCQPVPGDAAVPARLAGQPPALDDLSDYQRKVLWLRVGHLLAAETGFRSGDPLHPAPGEPHPAYDPGATTLGQRRRAKVAELKALGSGEAALPGLGKVSERTLERMAAAWKDRGPAGCIDGRRVRAGGGHPGVTEEVREAIFAVRAETRKRSRTGMRDKHVLVAQYAAEHFGPQVPVPGFWTVREVWKEWFGPGGTRPRYDRSADGVEAAGVHVLRWNGLPPEGEVPAFSDKTAEELLREARAAGLSPKSDADLLPVLLKLLGGVAPSSQWASQLSKKEKQDHARQAAQASQASADRHGPRSAAARQRAASEGNVVPIRPPERAVQVSEALDAERRRRREAVDTTWRGKSGICTAAGRVHVTARQQPDPLGFETALHALARELDDPATLLVNYQKRRQALESWCIDEDTWAGLTSRLRGPGSRRPDFADCQRQVSAVYVWVQLTAGEHNFAPRPIEAAQPPEIQHDRKHGRRSAIWARLHNCPAGPRYSSLKAELDALATSLAQAIDPAQS